jgi:cysteine-rich secretory family protein
MKFALYCAVIFLLASAHSLCAAQSMSPAEKRIWEELNHERVKNGLGPLAWNEQAAAAARAHTRLLVENADLSHQFPGEGSLLERLGATGARFTVAAENVARTGWIEDVHPALMGSPGHRANMLSPRYNAVGIGVMEEKGRIFVTQDFIFLVPEYSEALFASAFAESFNLARKRRKADIRADALLHELACATDGDAAKLAGQVSGARSVVVFTSSNPHSLPEQMLSRADDFHRMNFGVCFRPDQEHGYANFWVVATFAE